MTEDNPGAAELEPLGSRYLLETPIGSGAMGQVWRGATREGEPVAIKVLRPELSGDSGVVTRFLQERQILQGLSGPHLVHVRDLVVEGDKLAIVMDLVDGPDLRTELVRRGTFKPIEAAEVVDGILSGLAAVHAGDVVHRDVKPENVLLSGGQPSGVRLTDFGVARIVEEGQKSRRTTVIGTPEYLSPEVADGGDPTRASDLYAVGIMLYELVAGVTPFSGGSPLAVLRRHAEQQPVRPEGMPDGIWEVVSALLTKNPAQRPSDAEAVRQRLLSLAPDFAAAPALRPLEAPPVAAVVSQPTVMGLRAETQAIGAEAAAGATRAPQAPRKRRTALIVAAAALVLVLVAGGVTLLMLNRRGAAAQTASSTGSLTSSAADSTTASSSATETTSDSPAQGTVPAVTGMSLGSAQTAVTNAGLRVQVNEVLDDKAVDNTVTAQDPVEGTTVAPGSTVTLTVARKAVGVYLVSMQPVEYHNSYNATTTNLNGKTYVQGITSETGCSNVANLQYDLGRHYKTFTMVAGLSDDSSSAGALQVDVTIDGRSIFSQVAKLGQPVTVNVDVTGGLRLSISAARVEPNCSYNNEVHAVWGDPEIFGSPDEVPSPTASPTS